jgi:hypothetical protein
MVTKAKKPTTRPRRTQGKASKSDSNARAATPEEFDFDRANKEVERLIRENLDWLKEMAKR